MLCQYSMRPYHFCACRTNIHLPASVSLCVRVFIGHLLLPWVQWARSVHRLMLHTLTNDWQELVCKHLPCFWGGIVLTRSMLAPDFPSGNKIHSSSGKLAWLCSLYWLLPFTALPTPSLSHSNTYLSAYFRSTQTETVVMSPELTFRQKSNFQNYFLRLSISFGFSDMRVWCGSESWMSAKQYSASKASGKTSPHYLVTEQRQRNYADINLCPWKDYFLVYIYNPRLNKEHLSYSVPCSGFFLRLLGLWFNSGSGSILLII